MYKWFKKILFAIFICITPLACVAVEAKVESIDTIRLEQAGNLIKCKEYKRGYISFKKMARNGCPYSQCILGIMHQSGVGAKKNPLEAKYWFEKSARQGFADAEHRLGLMYYYGEGIKKNLVLAKQWLNKAASHGVQEAEILVSKIPEIPNPANPSNTPEEVTQQITTGIANIGQSWQGYSAVTQQLNYLESASVSH